MLDNQLIQLFRPVILSGLSALGLSNVVVRQSFQPTLQGAESGGVVYFYKLFDYRYGSLGYRDEWDIDNDVMRHVEIQHYETTFQINAMWIQNPSDVNGLTASDLVNIVSQIMQQPSTFELFASNDVGILRITEVGNTYFKDDYNNFEASPSFDFTLSHKQIREINSPIIDRVEENVYQI